MKGFFQKIGAARRRMMYGRNGNDGICLVLMWCYLALWLLSVVFSALALEIVCVAVRLLQSVVLAYWIFRVFSKNVARRRAEVNRFFGFFRSRRNRFRDRRTHVYKKCPHCRAMLRLPKRKGSHTVCCPACKERFSVMIRRSGSAYRSER